DAPRPEQAANRPAHGPARSDWPNKSAAVKYLITRERTRQTAAKWNRTLVRSFRGWGVRSRWDLRKAGARCRRYGIPALAVHHGPPRLADPVVGIIISAMA